MVPEAKLACHTGLAIRRTTGLQPGHEEGTFKRANMSGNLVMSFLFLDA